MGKKLINIHDAYFKAMMSEPELVVDFVRWVLPEKVLNHLKLDTLKLVKDSFIDNRLKSTFSDALFSVKTTVETDPEVLVSILIEHKSGPAKHTSFQTLSYVASAYLAQIKSSFPLSLIIPVVYYHGKDKWNLKHPVDFFPDVSKDLKHYIPDFKIEFADLSKMNETDMNASGNKMLYAALHVQKFSYNSEALVRGLSRIMETIVGHLSGNFLDQTIVYILEIIDKEPEYIIDITENLEPQLKEKFMSTYQKFIQKGVEKGKIEGKFNEKKIVVHKLHDAGMDIEFIMKVTELSREVVEKIIRDKADK